ncbi:hypothetical protein Arub01_14260 [Actinomadura rubrobrunea]|uniref:ABC transporter permease n=1 Tax=Actinomadura rubrobrunea TaxID=115335 RepID=A0A9W6UVF2_9ACTN|nr:hypothetical protein [Actinomadura rubrobrunea]GLW63182.1 hypothetical protein Arub01_14260 [Actinomadura rubrobrunea]
MRTCAVVTVLVALLGVPAGLLWARLAPDVTYVVFRGQVLPADPEGQGPIAVDGTFALVGAAAGLICGLLAYLAGGRGNDIPLLFGLALGGLAAALLAWRVGHQVGLAEYERALRGAPDGRTVTGVADLRATGVLVFWPLLAVAAYGAAEAVVRRLPGAGDGGDGGAGEADQVPRGQLDLQSAPAGRDVDGREP